MELQTLADSSPLAIEDAGRHHGSPARRPAT
jgi:hypothetical protein